MCALAYVHHQNGIHNVCNHGKTLFECIICICGAVIPIFHRRPTIPCEKCFFYSHNVVFVVLIQEKTRKMEHPNPYFAVLMQGQVEIGKFYPIIGPIRCFVSWCNFDSLEINVLRQRGALSIYYYCHVF